MKNNKFKSCLIVFLIFCSALCSFIGISKINSQQTLAQDTSKENYYESKLTGNQKLFYTILDKMNTNGIFKSGLDYTVTKDDGFDSFLPSIIGYTKGDNTLLKDFGAGLDSYRYDHCELFYINFDLLTITIGQKGSDYVLKIGSGRMDNYFNSNFNASNIESYINTYNNALNEFYNQAITGQESIKDKIVAINKAICNKVRYGFGKGEDSIYANDIRTTYGALVNGLAVCEGYARLFKACMDKLNVPCVLVSGYGIVGEYVEEHMWNYVYLEDKWLGVDVTWNDGDTEGAEKKDNLDYMLVNGNKMFIEHKENSEVSTSTYQMPYPEIHTIDRVINNDNNYISDDEKLIITSKEDVNQNTIVTVSYDGMGARKLQNEQGLIMAMRMCATNTGDDVWSSWSSFRVIEIMYGTLIQNFDNYSIITIGKDDVHVSNIQISILTIAEDTTNFGQQIEDTVLGNGEKINDKYSDGIITQDKIKYITPYFRNMNNDSTYVPAPYVEKTTPSTLQQKTNYINDNSVFDIEITYDKPLKKIDENQPIGIIVSTTRNGNAINNPKYEMKIENIVLKDDKRTISFKFTPSKHYLFDYDIHTFTLTNLIDGSEYKNEVIRKTPNSFGAVFARKSIQCSKCLPDNRWFFQVYAHPTLITNTDLSVEGWEYVDKDGQTRTASQNQRSQLALVVTKPNNQDNFEDAVKNNLNTQSDALLTAETYELDLHMCGKISKIANGSYLNVSFGYPEGYSFDNKDVTFKIYHFLRNDETGELDYDNPQILECVCTQYGITVTVDSFSPYTVVVLEKEKITESTKTVMASINGFGGKITSSMNGGINVLKENESITYTFIPDSNYVLDYVLLNNKVQKITDNKLILNYEDMQDTNNIIVGFVAQSILDNNQNDGIEDCSIKFYSSVATFNPEEDGIIETQKSIFIVVVLITFVLLLGFVVVFAIKNKKTKKKIGNK